MASLFEIDLGEDVQKAQKSIENVAAFTVGNAAGDVALQAIQETSEKAKAAVDAIIQSVENDVLMIAIEGALRLYDSLGLNEANIEFARNIVKMAQHASNLAASAVLRGMNVINSMDMHALPISAVAAALSVSLTFADLLVGKLIDKYGVWAEMAIQFVVDPGSVLEQLEELINVSLQQIQELIDEQLYQYLGMSIAEIKRMCMFGINLYKEYKAAKKMAREAKDDMKPEDRDTVVEAEGKTTKVNIKVNANPNDLKMSLFNWLRQTGDGLFNGFLVLQILDAVKEIQEVIKTLTDISLVKMAETINSMQDLIDMLEELGLGDDSTAIDLSLVPKLNINDIVASFNSLVDNFDAVQVGTSLALNLLSNAEISGSVTHSLDYKITTEVETQAISITIYNDPDKSSSKIYKKLKKAKDSNNKALFTEAELKIILEHINNLFGDGSNENFKIGKYTFDITLVIDEGFAQEWTKSEVLPDEQQITGVSERGGFTAELEVRETIRKEKADAETVRNTIAILHTAFSILKSLIGPLDTLIVLISNYQTNKEYVRHAHMENLVTCFIDAMKYLGLDKKSKMDGETPDSPRLYTVRTISLYDYVNGKLKVKMEGDATSELLSSDQIMNINSWLATNEKEASLIETEGYTKLFIDIDSIRNERACIEKFQEDMREMFGPGSENIISGADSCRKVDGTFDNIDKIEMCGDMIAYADSLLPRLPSQIDILLAQGYDRIKHDR